MSKVATRAIILKDDELLVMFRNKHGHQYYTLVGGQVNEGEDLLDALKREVMEETGLTITSASEVFYEKHRPPYDEQHIYLCEASSDSEVNIQSYSEEALMNKLGMNVHKPLWVSTSAFKRLPFRTPQLHQAIIDGLESGFPDSPQRIN
ncbi:MAG: NUDIX domain-containing protein [Candidatus Saccharibacteria bacterium]|nr:NUDIX domain-containing protein [Candidatus Saccharibacteria bacterium]